MSKEGNRKSAGARFSSPHGKRDRSFGRPLECFSLGCLLVLGSSSCAVRSQPVVDSATLSSAIRDRTGGEPSPDRAPSEFSLPPGVSWEDGLTSSEAVAVAFWNNSSFLAALSELGFARADLIQSGLLRNPILSLLFPLGPKQFEATLTWSIESFWLRPRRVKLAQLELDRVAQGLIENGLDLAHRTRQSHRRLLLAQDRLELAREELELHREIARIFGLRLEAGDISRLEASTVLDDAALFEQSILQLELDVLDSENALRSALGLGKETRQLQATAVEMPLTDLPPLPDLIADAFASRPDVRAAELQLEAAGARAGLRKAEVWKIAGLLDINGEGRKGFEAGPGLLLDLPIFDRNQAGAERARAEMEQSTFHYVGVQKGVADEIRVAFDRYQHLAPVLSRWRGSVLPAIEETVGLNSSAFEAGEVSRLDVLFVQRRLVQARRQVTEVAGQLHLTALDLDRALGRNRFAP